MQLSGDIAYIVWLTNMTGNNEVMLTASADSGHTFSNKINEINSIDTDSRDAQVGATDGGNFIVTWWETNETNAEPIMKISTDNGLTVGQILMLGEMEPSVSEYSNPYVVFKQISLYLFHSMCAKMHLVTSSQFTT